MTEAIKLRAALPVDSTDAQRIVFGILRSYGIEPDPDHLDREIVNFGANDPKIVREFSATVNEKLVGVCTLKLAADPRGALITSLFVDPEARGRGIGRSLLIQAVMEAQKIGLKRLTLETRQMFKEAIRLYESCGWKRGPDLPEGYGPDRTYFLDLC